MYTTKTEIKAQLKEELKCPQDFIDRINKAGWIDDIKDADDRDTVADIMKDIYDEYRYYCKQYELDIKEDNRD